MRGARLLVALAGVVLALVVVEVGLRFNAERRAQSFSGAAIPSDDTEPDRLLVAWWRPGYNAPDGLTSFDNHGFRQNGTPRSDPGERPVVMLGGSTAFSWGASDDKTITAYLEGQLQQQGRSARVLNAGYPGLTSLDTVLVYHARVALVKPGVVVLLAGLNDVYYAVDWIPENRLNWLSRVYETGLRARHEPALRSLVDAIDRIALGNCFTCYAFSTGFSQLYERTKLVPALRVGQLFGLEPVGTSNSRAMQLTAWAIGDLAQRVRSDGGCLVVAWQPIAGLPNGARTAREREAVVQVADRAPTWPVEAPRMWAELIQATRPLFRSGLAIEADLTRAFDTFDGLAFVDDGVHYTPPANQHLAEALTPFVLQC
jgi:hypothetical protein